MAEDEATRIQAFGFSDPKAALRARDAIRTIAAKEIGKAGTNPQRGRVMSIDLGKMTAQVQFPGDPGPVNVKMYPDTIPSDIGDDRAVTRLETDAVGPGAIVIVEYVRGSQYITQVVSGGQFGYEFSVAGLNHKMLSAATIPAAGSSYSSPAYGLFEKHLNIGGNMGDVQIGQAWIIGPWVKYETIIPGSGKIIMEVDYGIATRTYEFTVNDEAWGSQGNPTLVQEYGAWQRVLPSFAEDNLGSVEVAVDFAILPTRYRATAPAGRELWIRFIPLTDNAVDNNASISIKTFGVAFTAGDPKTGRIVAMVDTSPVQFSGWIGFHNASSGFYLRSQHNPAGNPGAFAEQRWNTGPWRDGSLRAANDLTPLWTTDGQFTWSGTHLKWTNNVIFSGIGPSRMILPSGKLQAPMPAVGRTVPVLPRDTDGYNDVGNIVTADGIPLSPGQTLYYGLPPSFGTGGLTTWMAAADCWFIVDSTLDVGGTTGVYEYVLPEWAIPIAKRAHSTAEPESLYMTNHMVQQAMDDKTKYCYVSSTAALNTLSYGGVGHVLLSLPSFTYKKGCAYRVTAKGGIQVNGTVTATLLIMLRYFKGTTTSGTDYGEYGRMPVNQVGLVYTQATPEMYWCNNTGADITTQVSLIGVIGGGSTQTFNHWGGPASPRYVRAEYAGSASKYPHGTPIT